MEVFTKIDHQALADFIFSIKSELDSWQLVEIKILSSAPENISSRTIGGILYGNFVETEGKIYICNPKEVLGIIKTGNNTTPEETKEKIILALPPRTCEVQSEKITKSALTKIELSLAEIILKDKISSEQIEERKKRKKSVLMIADDDFYVRTLVRKGFENQFDIIEAENGDEALVQYKTYIPDLLFLDIHMPGKTGIEVLKDIYDFDSEAYIVMLSADTLSDQIRSTYRKGVKGFVAKPFVKSKLASFLEKCPTIKHVIL